ncbi:GumC family protein [Taibaiella soli]|uniref:Capsular biosynthesis protein n=1 Tax=Taibaiella soli TaxID=1649169 RepID=A0A2W2AFF7_9BACT|nr:tyrosine-protein kinase [Taibaiella soli]PZF74031.1 capsular biosynthesis protein [Taibaiella soli]
MQDKNYTNHIVAAEQQEEGSLNVHKLIGIVMSHWVWFAVSLFLTLILSFVLLRYSTPAYKINATVLINDDQKAGNMDGKQLLEDLGFLSGKGNVDNEVEIFKSRSLMESVVRDMQLNVNYFSSGRVKKTPLYEDVPFHFVFIPLYEDSVSKDMYTFSVKINGDNIALKCSGKKCNNVDWKGKFGQTVSLPIGKLQVIKNPLVKADEEEYRVDVQSTDEAVEDYRKALTANVVNKQVTLINLSLQSNIPHQGEDALNKLINVYLQANVDDKNKIADSTMRFIDDRVALVGEELTGIEKKIEAFKKENELTDIGEESKILLGSTSDYMKQLTQSEVQLSIVESLQKYLHENVNNRRVVPSSLVLQDPTFVALIDKYNGVQLERERMLMSTTEENPMVRNMDQQSDNLRGDINNSLASLKRELQTGIRELQARTGGLDEKIKQVPTKERVFLEYSRQQNIKQELYLFLLQKREETAVQKSSTLANVRIIDPAKSENDPYKPKKAVVFLTAILLGLLIPGSAIYIKNLVNTRIETKDDITDKTKVAIVGEIGHNTEEAAIVVERASRDKLSEQFRVLRTNVQFLLKAGNHKTIALTSTMSGEGKSFVAINLASALALTGKKVVLVDLDLRKPKIAKKLRLERSRGFTNYIVGQAKLEDILQVADSNENLTVVTSGPVPPNPAELLMMPAVNTFFEELREHFDYIVVDTAPIGLVTDAQLLDQQVDATLYVVRQGYTYKQQLNFVNELYTGRKMPQLSLVVNDVKAGNGYYDYNYGYSYAGYYGYDSYYEGDDDVEDKQGLIARLKLMAQKGGLN